MAHPGFFERQASARRNTSVLVMLFLVAFALVAYALKSEYWRDVH